MNIQEYINSGILDLYVTESLSPTECREVEELQTKHIEIGQEIAAIQAALESYAMAHRVTPSEKLKNKILDAISLENPASAAAEAPQTAKIVDLQNTNSTPWYATQWAVAAATTGLVASVALNFLFYTNWQQAKTSVANLIAEKSSFVENANVKNASYVRHLTDLVSPATHVVVLKGLPVAPSAKVAVYWNKESKNTLLAVHNLPKAPSDKQYQLWALLDGKPIDAGLYDTNLDSNVQEMKNIANAQAFAITLEPKGGSASPTLTQMYVMGTL